MKTRLIKKVALAGIIALLLSTQAAYAQPVCGAEGYEGGQEHRGERKGRLIERLDLTEEQQEQLKEQRQENKNKRRETHEALREKQAELREELRKTDADKSKIESTVSEIKKLQGEMIDGRVESFLKMKELLTPEQFSKFLEFQEEHRQRKGKKGNRRGGRFQRGGW